MSLYASSGDRINIFSENNLQVHQELPAAVYSVNTNPMTGEIFLEKVKPFILPKRVYGNTLKMANRILNTFEDRPTSTGAHLDGVKGSGKTLLSKQIGMIALDRGYPVILINQPLSGENFNRFIQSIDTPTVIIFDEFEKVYNTNEAQNAILTLFDGVYPSKKLFVLTTNDSHKVSDFMKNRPGRMFYSLSFDCLDQDTIREFLNDTLNNKDRIEEILRYTSVYTFFNFDMLAALVEEMNRYDEPLAEAIKYMNIKPEIHKLDTFNVHVAYRDMAFCYSQNTDFDPSDVCYFIGTHNIASRLAQSNNPEFVNIPRGLSRMNRSTEDKQKTADIEQAYDKLYESIMSAIQEIDDEDDEVRFDETHLVNYDHKKGQFVFRRELKDGEYLHLYVTRNPRDRKQGLLY